MPFLTGLNTNTPHDKLFWRMGGGSALAERKDDFELVRLRKKPEELYDLDHDISETNNLANTQIDEVKKLDTDLDGWNKQLIPPAFPGLAGHTKSAVEP
jgi:hypothetical protein